MPWEYPHSGQGFDLGFPPWGIVLMLATRGCSIVHAQRALVMVCPKCPMPWDLPSLAFLCIGGATKRQGVSEFISSLITVFQRSPYLKGSCWACAGSESHHHEPYPLVAAHLQLEVHKITKQMQVKEKNKSQSQNRAQCEGKLESLGGD